MQLLYYFNLARRNIIVRKSTTFLNILGLGIGLAGCLVIFLILQHEFSYDGYHKNAQQVYELVKNVKTSDGNHFEIGIPFPAADALRNDYPQLRVSELFTLEGAQVTVNTGTQNTTGTKKFIEDRGFFYADPDLFDLFDVQWLTGSPAVLKNRNTVVLSRSLAEKYFGSPDIAMGQYIQLNNTTTAKVSGIIADPPSNTDFAFKGIVSYPTLLANASPGSLPDERSWVASISSHQVYLRLPKNMSARSFNKSLASFVAKYSQDDGLSKRSYFLQPLSAIHFDTRFENNGDHISSKTSLYTLGLIGVLILMMACINFVNLSTALAATRSKEMGVRKVLGSSRIQLGLQMLIETGLVVLLSLGLALMLASASLPYIHYISPIEQPLPLFTRSSLLFLVAAFFTATFLSGGYPALQLGRYSPIEAIRNKIDTTQLGGLSLRRVLVVLQFSFSQLLIIATIVAVSQMNYIRNADLGTTKESVLLLEGKNDSSFLAKQTVFKTELAKLSDVKAVSFAFDAPSSGEHWQSDFSYDNINTTLPFFANLKFGDADYANTFGLQMAAGNWYTKDDSINSAVINETLAAKLGVRDLQTIIGKKIRIGGEGSPWRSITGVVKDFKNASLKEGIPPDIIVRSKRFHQMAAVRLRSGNLGRSTREVQAVWDKYYPEYAFNSQFMDENIERFYRQEQRLSVSYKAYTLLAILISSLGLYGLVSFVTVQKTKEVGIRKVLGASVGHIVYLFTKEFTVLISIAFLIAAPVAYFMMTGWLQDFVYRIHIGVGVFLITLVLSLGIAWITVGYKSIKAALANPAKSLKTE